MNKNLERLAIAGVVVGGLGAVSQVPALMLHFNEHAFAPVTYGTTDIVSAECQDARNHVRQYSQGALRYLSFTSRGHWRKCMLITFVRSEK